MIDYRIVIIGAVKSTLQIIKGLLRNHANVIGVMGLAPNCSENVSGYVNLEPFCKSKGIPFHFFEKINDEKSLRIVRNWNPDYLFAVGFSQLLGQDILNIPKKATIGFHPTYLPKGRGRAPLSWITYNCEPGAANFFVIGNGIDDGPILVQEPFIVDPDDHAEDVENKILGAIDIALDCWIPKLLRGEWKPQPQNDSKATYTGIRKPIDGLVYWDEPLQKTFARIRAASRPHPGAYTYVQGRKMIIWRAEIAKNSKYSGVPGRILFVDSEKGFLVQSGEGQLWLTEYEFPDSPGEIPKLRVGTLLGFNVQHEISKLYQRIDILEKELERLKKKI